MSLKKLSLFLVAAVLATGATLYSQGSQHVPLTGSEEAVLIQPWWAGFTTVQTWSLPSLQVDELVLTFEASSPGGILFPLGDLLGFKGFGTGKIYNEGGDYIGDFTFYYMGQTLGLPPVFDYLGESAIVGTFFAGPLEGLTLTQTALMEGNVVFTMVGSIPVPSYPYYHAEIKGYLTVPEFVDFQALKNAVNAS